MYHDIDHGVNGTCDMDGRTEDAVATNGVGAKLCRYHI